MLKRYLAARYALYYKLIEENHKLYEETGEQFYADNETEARHRMLEVADIINGVFGKPTGFEIKKEAREWAQQVELTTIYNAIDKYQE